MNLTDRERQLFDLFKEKTVVSVDDIIKAHGGARSSAIVRVKYLGAKISSEGYFIERSTGLGRGAKASYELKRVQE